MGAVEAWRVDLQGAGGAPLRETLDSLVRMIEETAAGPVLASVLLLDRDGGLKGRRGEAARLCLYLFERDQAVGLIRGG